MPSRTNFDQGQLAAHGAPKPIRADQSAECWFHMTENMFMSSEFLNTCKTLSLVQD